ncbi:MAG: sigma factor, partial [Thermoanaerobaculia bacterium]
MALAELYDATSHRVYGLALHILRENEAAEEATLDVYTQIWRKGAQYDPSRGSVMGFILTLARTRGVDLLRTRARRSGFESPLQD